MLIENAYAACEPTREIMDTFAYQLNILVEEGEVTEQDALSMRSMPAVFDAIAEKSGNDPQVITPEFTRKIHEKFSADIDNIKHQRDEACERLIKVREAVYSLIENTANRSADRYATRIKRICAILTITVFVAGIFALVFSCFRPDVQYTTLTLACLIIITLIAIYGFIDSVMTKRLFLSRWITKKRNSRFDSEYNKQMELYMKDKVDI